MTTVSPPCRCIPLSWIGSKETRSAQASRILASRAWTSKRCRLGTIWLIGQPKVRKFDELPEPSLRRNVRQNCRKITSKMYTTAPIMKNSSRMIASSVFVFRLLTATTLVLGFAHCGNDGSSDVCDPVCSDTEDCVDGKCVASGTGGRSGNGSGNGPVTTSSPQRVCTNASVEKDCRPGEVCRKGFCAPDPCRKICLSAASKCEGKKCKDDETCLDGVCIAGCFPPEECLLGCSGDEVCFRGRCQDLPKCDGGCDEGLECRLDCLPCNGECEDNQRCVNDKCVADPCFDKECPSGQRCLEGSCVDFPCADLKCSGGEICRVIDGKDQCVDSCDCTGKNCADNARCELGDCGSCKRLCDPAQGKKCGDDDKCNGTCDIESCPGQGTCEKKNGKFTCECQPDCEGKNCGESDGCPGGNTCSNNTCGPGETCREVDPGSKPKEFACLCSDSCSGIDECGAKTPCGVKECPGKCSDPDDRCAKKEKDKFTCECRPQCKGKPCNAPDGCGTGGRCGSGSCGPDQRCFAKKDGTGQFECRCSKSCKGKACGEPDTCGKGSCKGTCDGEQEQCQEQSDGKFACVCKPKCSGKPCGAKDGCGGFCGNGSCDGEKRCFENTCQSPKCNPKGLCGAPDGVGGECLGKCEQPNHECKGSFNKGYNCVCVPQCQNKQCGDPNGCPGGKCSNQTCNVGKQCFKGECVEKKCDEECNACGEVCVGECQSICEQGQELCGCNDCCNADEQCFGVTCIPKKVDL